MKVIIGKSKWTISKQPEDVLEERWGACSHDKETIYIFKRPEHKDPYTLLGTICHEIIHARNKNLSEKAVKETEKAIIEVVKKLKLFKHPHQ